jgi:hypothetical protein
MSAKPVYRYPPRSHTASCPCPRCAQCRKRPSPSSDLMAMDAFFVVCIVLAVIGFWPAMVWHGYTDTGGWRWDIHSTIGCSVWWGLSVLCILLAVADKKAKRSPRPPEGRLRVEATLPPMPAAQASPVCFHRAAVPVDLSTGERVAWWCPDCETQLDPGFRASELTPAASWAPIRRRPS